MASTLSETTISKPFGNGLQPHLINIQFQKKVRLQLVVLYLDFKLDESYTPSKISIRAGDGFHNLKEIKSVELVKPSGWVCVSMSGTDPRDTFVNTFMLQISILSNHLDRAYAFSIAGIVFRANHFSLLQRSFSLIPH
ncbi:PREDICTED: anaphase-promoting complex subunit 10 [Brassica oleracea var. oleracea]|uniref:DOC domain-containing protein n=1 Tax=Brassica oleracea var. oleracea TaxID=109376 RepID=A0A0D3D330_BRAOL|nr:PREDICTED: anaphase-promoting complex subunit 10 [Brassica oleracea var. oleracea]